MVYNIVSFVEIMYWIVDDLFDTLSFSCVNPVPTSTSWWNLFIRTHASKKYIVKYFKCNF